MKPGDHIDEKSAIAIVFLHSRNDSRNRAILTSEDLIIIRKAKSHIFALDNIRLLAFHKRKLLLPLIMGGILVPLGLVAMFGDYFNPYLVVLLILSGIYLFYEGFNERWTLTVHGLSSDVNFSLFFVSDNLRAFVDFVNGQLPSASGTVRKQGYIYLLLPLELWTGSAGSDNIDLGTTIHKAYTRRQWVAKKDRDDPDQVHVILTLNPLKAWTRINYDHDRDTGEFRPLVHGILSKDAIVEVKSLQGLAG